MAGWGPEDFTDFHAGLDVHEETITLRGKPVTVLVGQYEALIAYQAQRRNPVLEVALAVDPPRPSDEAEPADGPAAPSLAEQIGDTMEYADKLFALAVIAPKYYPAEQMPADGSLPHDGLCVRSFHPAERAQLVRAITGDTEALESFRPGATPAGGSPSDSEGVRDDTSGPADPPGVDSTQAVVQRGDPIPRRAGRKTVAGRRAGASAA